MLLGKHFFDRDRIALLELRECGFSGFYNIVAALFVQGGEASELLVLAIEAQRHTVTADLHRHRFVHRGVHLAGHETIVDQAVQIVLFLGQRRLDLIRRAGHIRRADSFVGILRILAAPVFICLLGQEFLAEFLRNKSAQGGQRFIAGAHAVRTDVGHDTLGTFTGQINAFVQLLHDLHCLGGGEI